MQKNWGYVEQFKPKVWILHINYGGLIQINVKIRQLPRNSA